MGVIRFCFWVSVCCSFDLDCIEWIRFEFGGREMRMEYK